MQIPDGIYVNLPMQAYQDDPALGSSDLKAILSNAVQWHARERNKAWRILNPPSEEESAATRFGTALHAAILEPDLFSERYHLTPDAPNLPSRKEDIYAGLQRIGASLPPKGADRETYVAFARQASLTIMDDWKTLQRIEAGGREQLSKAWWNALTMLQAVFKRHPEATKYVRNGRAEVSVFWTDANGVRLKCRFDYLRVRTVSDVKSYALRDGPEPVQNFVGAVETYGYDFSAAHYMNLRTEAVPALVAAGRVYDGANIAEGELGPVSAADADFFDQVAAWTSPTWWWLACLTMGFPEVDTVAFPSDLLQYSVAAFQVDQAKTTFIEYRDKFGEDGEEAWVADRGRVVLTDANFSRRSQNRGAALWERG